MDQKQNTNLDLLRALAVGFVLFSHVPYFAGWQTPASYELDTLGRLGVALFFVHTTLVLLLSLERSDGGAAQFFIRRFFRLWPLASAMVLLLAGLKLLAGRTLDLGELASNLLLVQNITGHKSTPDPLWTLPYEVQMYLALPLLFAATRASRPLLRVALILAGAMVLAFIAWRLDAFSYSLVRYVPCFLPGALAFVLRRRVKRYSAAVLFGGVVLPAAVLAPMLVAAGVPEVPLFWSVCLALGLVIPLCRPIRGAALTRAASVVATYSYGLYLTHVLAFGLAFPGGTANGLAQWAALCVLLPAFAFVAYRLIERPGIELGARLCPGPRHAFHFPVRP